MTDPGAEITKIAEAADSSIAPDVIVLWPLYSGLIILLLFCTVVTWPIAEYAFSMIFILWAIPCAIVVAILLVAALWVALRAVIKGFWRRAMSALALPIMLVLALPASFAATRTANELHFVIFKHKYLAAVANDKNVQDGRIHFFDWGGDAMIGFDRFLVFDESDEIILSPSQRSERFAKKLEAHGFSGNQKFGLVQTVASHFYVVDF